MKTYVHKPTTVQAVHFDPAGAHRSELPKGVKCFTQFDPVGNEFREHGYSQKGLVFHIENDKGWIKVFANDWVVYGSRGEIYPVAPEIFADNYQEG